MEGPKRILEQDIIMQSPFHSSWGGPIVGGHDTPPPFLDAFADGPPTPPLPPQSPYLSTPPPPPKTRDTSQKKNDPKKTKRREKQACICIYHIPNHYPDKPAFVQCRYGPQPPLLKLFVLENMEIPSSHLEQDRGSYATYLHMFIHFSFLFFWFSGFNFHMNVFPTLHGLMPPNLSRSPSVSHHALNKWKVVKEEQRK